MKRLPASVLKITLIYLLSGMLWIALSDRILEALVHDLQTLNAFQTYKGWFYVLITTLLLFILVKDSVDRIQAEEERFKRLFEGFPIGLYRREPDGRLLNVNQALVDILGYPDKQTLLALNAGDFFVDREDFELINRTLKASGDLHNFTTQMYKYDRSKIWAEIHTAASLDTAGNPVIEGGLIDITARRSIEEALNQEQKFIQALIETSPIFFAGLDRLGRLVKMNKTMLAALGYEWEEVENAPYLPQFVPVREHRRVAEVLDSLLQKEDSIQNSNHIIAKDGRELFVEWHNQTIRNRDGQVDYLFGYGIDITDRRKAKEALQASEERYRTIVEDQTEFIVRWLPGGIRTFVNESYCRYYGLTREQAIGTSFMELISEQDREVVLRRIAALSPESPVSTGEHQVTRPDGTIGWNQWTDRAFFDKSGEVLAYQSVGQDITERKLAEEEIQKLSDVVKQSPMYIMITDLHGRIEYVNPAFSTITGYAVEEALGKNPRFLKSGKTPESIYRDLWNTITAGETWKGEILNKKKDGTTFWENATITASANESGAITHFVAIKEDITDRKKAEEEIQKLNADLIKAYDGTIEAWAHALEIRDIETEGHSRRVVDMTLALAERLGFGDEEMLHIRRGALLHDIGKMGVPDAILQKPGSLTPAEWEIMKRHPLNAQKWLSAIENLHFSIDIPCSHHEKWDGSGYPRGLKGEKIPIAARLFAVVDVFDALTSDRPYRKAWSREEALAYIQDQSGKHFDPEIVKAFFEFIESR